MRPVDRVLQRLKGVRTSNSSYKALCPVPNHRDQNPSLSVAEGDDGRVLLKCFAGCETRDIVTVLGLGMSELFERPNGKGEEGSSSSKLRSTDQPCTLVNYAALKELPPKFLESLGLVEYHRNGKKAVSMPYFDATGNEVLLKRSRVSLTGKPKVMTRKGDRHHLYGLWKREEALEAGYAILAEGESDCHTGWYRGRPMLGVPGANGWKNEWASELDGVDKILVVVEDEAGETLWEKLAATPEIQERLYRVELGGVKDLSELHIKHPEGFDKHLDRALKDARAWWISPKARSRSSAERHGRPAMGLPKRRTSSSVSQKT